MTTPKNDGIDHVTLPIGDLARAEEFYVGLLGAELRRKLDREAFLRHSPERAEELEHDNSPLHLSVRFADGPELQLFLQRGYRRARPRPHPHLAVMVDHDDLDRFHARLAAARVPTDGPRRLGPPGHASLYFADPWNNLLELVTMGYEGPVELGPPVLDAIARI